MTALKTLAFFLVALPLCVIWSGYALSILWVWLIQPVFALPALTLAQAIGLSLVAGFLTHQRHDEDITPKAFLIHSATRPAVYLLFGWIAQHWI